MLTSIRPIIFLAACLVACHAVRPRSAPTVPAASPLGEVPGTYDLALCRAAPCVPGDTMAAYVLATVVLFDSAGAVAADMPPPPYELQRATGCMVMRHRRPVPHTYAGASAREYFIWSGNSDSLVFPLFRSPDAFYTVRLRRTERGLTGIGHSFGVGAAEIHGPADSVVAVRTGPPVRLRCHKAAE